MIGRRGVAVAAASAGIVAMFATASARTRATPASSQAATPPPITLLYQNFPNPFPTTTSPVTCLWFDLAHDESSVTLAIYDLRGRLVRTIVPSSTVGSTLPAGYYGRAVSGASAGGCAAPFVWDGRGSTGVTVPAGVYLARLHADGAWQTKKIVFRGP